MPLDHLQAEVMLTTLATAHPTPATGTLLLKATQLTETQHTWRILPMDAHLTTLLIREATTTTAVLPSTMISIPLTPTTTVVKALLPMAILLETIMATLKADMLPSMPVEVPQVLRLPLDSEPQLLASTAESARYVLTYQYNVNAADWNGILTRNALYRSDAVATKAPPVANAKTVLA